MRYILLIAMFGFICGCASNQVNDTTASISSECEIPELTGRSCIEPNYEEISKHPLGTTGYNPIRVNGPKGQREYLSKLICPDGKPVREFSRAGSVGIGPYGFMLDLYNIKCTDKTYSIYMDMYHPNNVESRPADGFTVEN